MKSQNVTLFSAWLFIVSVLFIAGCSSENNIDPVVTLGVSSTIPANMASNVARNNPIEISFSEAMDPGTINCNTVIVLDGFTFVPGTVTYSEEKAVFKPHNDLMALTAYTITVNTGARTIDGKPFAHNSITSFTTGGSVAIREKVELGAAFDYVIVAETAINNNSTSAITGNVGISPAATAYITGLALTNANGYATSNQINGKVYAADMAAPTSANLISTVNNMVTAYDDAAGRTIPDFVDLSAGDIGGKTLTQGLYKWSGNVTIPSNIVLTGDSNDVWIFQIGGNLTTSSAINITLEGGVLPENIFWQVGGQVTIGTQSHFKGIILSTSSITLLNGASLEGKMLAQTTVTMDHNAITMK